MSDIFAEMELAAQRDSKDSEIEALRTRLAEADREIALLDTAYNKEIRRRVELESLLRETSARLDLDDYGELFATIDAFLGRKEPWNGIFHFQISCDFLQTKT